MAYCPTCGSPVGEDDAFCGACDTDLRATAADATTVQPTAPIPQVPPVQPQPAPPQPTATQPSATQPRSHKGLIVGIIIGAVVLLGAIAGVAFAGYYFYLRPKPVVRVTKQTTTQTSSTGTAETTASGNTSTTTSPVEAQNVSTSSSASSALHSPKWQSPERRAILDALRVPVQKKLHQRVAFVVDRIAVKDSWAFVYGRPVQPNGKAIDYRKTPYAQAVKDGFFGDDFSGLLRLSDGSWKVVTYDIGATDVVWEPWAHDYGAPTAIFGTTK